MKDRSSLSQLKGQSGLNVNKTVAAQPEIQNTNQTLLSLFQNDSLGLNGGLHTIQQLHLNYLYTNTDKCLFTLGMFAANPLF